MKKQKLSRDSVLNNFFGRPEIFADLFNTWIYDGEQVIRPEALVPAARLLSETIANSKGFVKLTRFRDIFKVYRDKDATYIMLGIENQSAIHYAMPLRNMIYDALALLARVRQKQKKHLALKDLKHPDEYLSRFSLTDHLDPVITLVVYTGSRPWDGPQSLHEMIKFPNEKLRRYVPDYFINLIVPVKLSEAQLAKLNTELCEVFGYIKYAKDKDLLYAFIRQHPKFQELSYDAVMAINVCTNAKIKLTTSKEEKINMCQALIDMKQEAWQDGHDSGWKDGHDSGVTDTTTAIVLRMHALHTFSIDDIAVATALSPAEINAILEKSQSAS